MGRSKKTFYAILVIGAAWFFNLNCGEKYVKAPPAAKPEPAKAAASLPTKEEPLPKAEVHKLEVPAAPQAPAAIVTWRVELATVRTKAEAMRVAQKAAADLGGQSYIISEPPNYKVQLGNYNQKEEAEKALEKAKKTGYPKAQIIEKK